jgi:hypothetical protein
VLQVSAKIGVRCHGSLRNNDGDQSPSANMAIDGSYTQC